MNQKRREKLKRAVALLEEASDITSAALDDERDCLYNMPENLQDSERCEKMEQAVDKLEEALEQIDSARECIEEASE